MLEIFNENNTRWEREGDEEFLVYTFDKEEFCEENGISSEEFDKAFDEYCDLSREASEDAREFSESRRDFQNGGRF